MVLDMPAMTMPEIGQEGHLATEIFQVPETGWKKPHNSPNNIIANGRTLDIKASSAANSDYAPQL